MINDIFSIQCPLWVLLWIDEVYLYYLYPLHQEVKIGGKFEWLLWSIWKGLWTCGQYGLWRMKGSLLRHFSNFVARAWRLTILRIWELTNDSFRSSMLIIIIIIIYFPSVEPYRITKSKWIWKPSHFRENKEQNHYKVYINNKAQYNI